MYQIENEICRISVKEHGSELCEMYDKVRKREYIWQAGPVWPKHGPLLFPAIGGFYGGTYMAGEKLYKMKAHGFARDMDFTPVFRAVKRLMNPPRIISACRFLIGWKAENLRLHGKF